jgi:hypothetical protein
VPVRHRSPARPQAEPPAPPSEPSQPSDVAPDESRARLVKRILPTFASAVIALAYVLIAPRSEDLAAHLLRAKLFAAEGWFGIWNNWWYAGHNLPGYSVLFPPAAALTTPQIAAAIACPASTAAFDSLARRRYGEGAWLASLWFGVATTSSLFTGRLTFAFGLLPAVGTALALQRRRPGLAFALAVLTALASPVDALFAALAGAAYAVAEYTHGDDPTATSRGTRRRLTAALPGIGVVVGALGPVLALGVIFPEGGTEPFAISALWPIVVLSVGALLVIPKRDAALRAGVALYALGCIAAYAVASPVGSNATRLAPIVAGPIAALLWWPTPRTRRAIAVLAVAAVPLLYLQWQAPVRDVRTADDNGEVTTAYFQPLIDYLDSQNGPPFRIEIPFTTFHWEAYVMAPRFPLARGWERQLDTKYNGLFYSGRLTPARYEAWLHELAIRFVAVSDADIDYSAKAEVALIDRGLPYLHLVLRTRHWRVYEVANASPIVQGAATLKTLGPNYLQLQAKRAGTAYIRVRYSPYWAVVQGSGCVGPAGGFTELKIRRPGPMRVAIRFSLGRIGAQSLRCS